MGDIQRRERKKEKACTQVKKKRKRERERERERDLRVCMSPASLIFNTSMKYYKISEITFNLIRITPSVFGVELICYKN